MLQKVKCFSSLIDNINLHYYANFLEAKMADKYFNILENNLVYNSSEQSKVKIMGKEYEINRKQVAYGSPGTYYEFAGVKVTAKSWDDKTDIVCRVIKNIKKFVEAYTGKEFNFCLINRYANGNDGIGNHHDKDKDLGENPCIVGVSLGAVRDVHFSVDGFIPKKLPESFNLQLDHGSLFVMFHPTNTHWKHSIPKRAHVKMPRISLTFRQLYL